MGCVWNLSECLAFGSVASYLVKYVAAAVLLGFSSKITQGQKRRRAALKIWCEGGGCPVLFYKGRMLASPWECAMAPAREMGQTKVQDLRSESDHGELCSRISKLMANARQGQRVQMGQKTSSVEKED